MPHPDAGGDDESHLMDAIYCVDSNRVVTSPDAAGPWDASMQHGSAAQSLLTAANAECH
jgi:hypothetical protein